MKILAFVFFLIGTGLFIGGISVSIQPSINPLITIIGAFALPLLFFWLGKVALDKSKKDLLLQTIKNSLRLWWFRSVLDSWTSLYTEQTLSPFYFFSKNSTFKIFIVSRAWTVALWETEIRLKEFQSQALSRRSTHGPWVWIQRVATVCPQPHPTGQSAHLPWHKQNRCTGGIAGIAWVCLSRLSCQPPGIRLLSIVLRL